MKIANKPGSTLANVEATKTTKSEGDRRTAGKSSAASTAFDGMSKVNLSDRAQSMQKAKDIASQSSVNESKVAQLQKMIDEGKYRVDAKAVADRLVDEHLLMTDES